MLLRQGEIKTYTVGENAVVEFAEAGSYEVGVYDNRRCDAGTPRPPLNAM